MRLSISFWAFCSVYLTGIKGYVNWVKSSKTRGVCYTNDTLGVVAFARELPILMNAHWIYINGTKVTMSERVTYRGILDSSKIPFKKDCNLLLGNHSCEAWTTKGFTRTDNLKNKDDLFQPIQDRRWNDLPEIATNGSYRFDTLLELGKIARGKIHVSILANESAQFLFTKNPTFGTGILVGLDGWDNRNESKIRYCRNISKIHWPQGCDDLATIKEQRDLSQRQWNTRTFNFALDQTVFLAVQKDNMTKLLIKDFKNHAANKGSVWKVAVKSTHYPALYKLHHYEYLSATEKDAKLETQVEVKISQALCLSVTYTAKKAIRVNVANEGKTVLEKTLEANAAEIDRWTTKKIVTSVLPAGNYNISIQVTDFESNIGDVRFCSLAGTEVVTTPDKVIACHSLNKQINYVPSPENELTTEEILSLCNQTLKMLNCKGVEFCNEDNQCSCLSGFKIGTKKPCEEHCTDGHYGRNCRLSAKRMCFDNKQNIHTGLCDVGCRAGYRSPECFETLLQFEVGPNVSDIQAYKAKVDLRNAMSKLNISRQDNIKYFFKTEIQKRTNSSPSDADWKTIASFPLHGETEYDISGLTPKTQYELRALIIEIGNQSNLENLNVTSFNTKACIPIDDSNTGVNVRDHGFLEIVRLVQNSSLCRWTAFQINDTRIGGNISIAAETNRVTHQFLKPNSTTNFVVVVYADDGSFITNNFTVLEIDGSNKVIAFIVIILLIVAAVVIMYTIYFRWKGNKKKRSLSNQEGNDNHNSIELHLGLVAERPAVLQNSTPGNSQDTTNSCVVRLSELGSYTDSAIQTNLLQKQHKMFPRGQTQPWEVGSDPANKKKNRCVNLAAYDATRVILDLLPGDEHSDYINANFIDGYKRPKAYIATQGPKKQTVHDFWRMICQEQVGLIVMVANIQENGKAKCEKYWPDLHNESQIENIKIRNEGEEVFADFVIRTFGVTINNSRRKITHLHFTTWPDHGVPLYPQTFATFAKKITHFKSDAPITIHCSTGVGRTGTIILIDACLRMAKAEGFVDILAILAQMRSQRANMVDDELEYQFAHLVLLESLVFPQFEIQCNTFVSEFNAILSPGGKLASIFSKLNDICNKEWDRLKQGTDDENLKEESVYLEIFAYPVHPVKLHPYGLNDETSTINAVYVDGYRQKKQFIATEVPNQKNIEKFWRMIQQMNVEQVIVLNDLPDDEVSFVPKLSEYLQFGDLEVTKESEIQLSNCKVDCCVTELNGSPHGIVKVVRVSGWKACQTCAPNIHSLVEIWEETEKSRSTAVRVVVCRDGVTACGLFLGMGFVLEKIKIEQQVDAVLATRILRQARPEFLSSQDQFEALLRAALVYLESFDTYGNFQ